MLTRFECAVAFADQWWATASQDVTQAIDSGAVAPPYGWARGCQNLRPAVEPVDALVGFRRRARAKHLFAQFGGGAARVIEVAVDARHDLHPRSAQIALLHVGAER